jgi:hypothetical protein
MILCFMENDDLTMDFIVLLNSGGASGGIPPLLFDDSFL